MLELGTIIMIIGLAVPAGWREVGWSTCETAFHAKRVLAEHCAIYDPEGKLDLSKLSIP